jgi:hypothetical protein
LFGRAIPRSLLSAIRHSSSALSAEGLRDPGPSSRLLFWRNMASSPVETARIDERLRDVRERFGRKPTAPA